MEEKKTPQPEGKKTCSTKDFCYCQAIGAILIIILIWWMPSWADIAITILAALMLLGAGGCKCRK